MLANQLLVLFCLPHRPLSCQEVFQQGMADGHSQQIFEQCRDLLGVANSTNHGGPQTCLSHM